MRLRTSLSLLVLPIVLSMLVVGTAAAQRTEEAAKSAVAESAVKRAPRGRLPAYFAAVITAKQREEIYRIQAQFKERLDRLRQQIADLESVSSEEIDAVLNPDQLQEVQEKRTAAERRRKERSNPGGEKPSTAPAS